MLVNIDDYITQNKHFKWSEALYLKQLNIYHSPTQEEVDNIIETCLKLDKVREFIAKPFNIHCWIRPNHVHDESGKHEGFDYNALVKGATKSQHIIGKAVDFDITGLNQDQSMKIIVPKLVFFQMSSEDNTITNGRLWVHLDNMMRNGKWCLFNP